jgi:hypothetical protein
VKLKENWVTKNSESFSFIVDSDTDSFRRITGRSGKGAYDGCKRH